MSPLLGMWAGTISYRIEGDICKGVETVLSFGAGQKVLGRLHFGCRIGCNYGGKNASHFSASDTNWGTLIFDDLGC
jgi:hypothetical protein